MLRKTLSCSLILLSGCMSIKTGTPDLTKIKIEMSTHDEAHIILPAVVKILNDRLIITGVEQQVKLYDMIVGMLNDSVKEETILEFFRTENFDGR